MNNWIKRVFTTLLIATQFAVIPAVSASSLEDIQSQKKIVEAELNQVQKDLNEKLAEVSEITVALDKLTQEIEEQEEKIVKTEEEIVAQELVVESRYEHTAEQLKAMQMSEINHNLIIGLFQSESLSDFVNRLYTASILTSANDEKLNEAHLEQEKLNALNEELIATKEELDSNKSEVEQQKSMLDEKLAGLKGTLANNQNKLNELNAEEEAIKAAAAFAAKERERANSTPQVTKTVKASGSVNQPQQAEASVQEDSSTAEVSSTQEGSWMTFESTGYSTQQAGLSTHTATGINLLVNPRVIAVDPSQIPLGSLVEVQGMGVYVAGDTGGAIKGRIIDVHFPTVAQALSWGRRSVKIRILN